jgi:dienelactone hydrolase
MDIYQPAGDTIQQRPVIVLAHGGCFIEGDKTGGHILTIAKSFAKRGYIVASINYRLVSGYTCQQLKANPAVGEAAVRNATEDMKAAVRFFRRYATTWKVDQNRISASGTSAGGVMSIHCAYEEYEGASGNPGYSSAVRAAAPIAAGTWHTEIMEAGEAPFGAVVGVNDDEMYPLVLNMVDRAQVIGLSYVLFELPAGHNLLDQVPQQTLNALRDVLWELVIN